MSLVRYFLYSRSELSELWLRDMCGCGAGSSTHIMCGRENRRYCALAKCDLHMNSCIFVSDMEAEL